MILNLNHCIDSGKYDDITIQEVYRHMEDGTVFEFLRDRLGTDFDEGGFSLDQDFKPQFINYLKRMHNAYSGDEQKKWGVGKKGLCLLLAWTNELLQQGSDWKSPKGMLEPFSLQGL
jgi:hypothetical protein